MFEIYKEFGISSDGNYIQRLISNLYKYCFLQNRMGLEEVTVFHGLVWDTHRLK